jgi:5-methylcytosine-specific restriction enzyme A
MAEWPYSTERWQRVRRRQLLREPLCRACQIEGAITQAVEVDHIKRVSVGGAVFDPANMQSLCKEHHSIKTKYEMHGKSFDAYVLRGCNVDGSPKNKNVVK